MDVSKLFEKYLPHITSDADRDYVLWEWTGWPAFFMGDPAECLEQQIKFYAETELCPDCEGWGNVGKLVDGYTPCPRCNGKRRVYPGSNDAS